ncbi:MAG: nucleotidyl transferase AbiEii/AbiGii toxin family protein [bacterium]
MDQRLNFEEVYKIQDGVLATVSSSQSGFYLTGGTCLNRFYKLRRHSDDLDLFCNDNELYRDYVREFKKALLSEGMGLLVEVDSRDFVRMKVESKLRVDLVNDRLPYVGRIRKSLEGFRIDNLENILANKLTAVVGRDDPKDVFDIVTITRIARFDWSTSLGAALSKSYFERDYLVYRLKTFPVHLLDQLAVVDPGYLKETKEALPTIVEDILLGRVNEPVEPLDIPGE